MLHDKYIVIKTGFLPVITHHWALQKTNHTAIKSPVSAIYVFGFSSFLSDVGVQSELFLKYKSWDRKTIA